MLLLVQLVPGRLVLDMLLQPVLVFWKRVSVCSHLPRLGAMSPEACAVLGGAVKIFSGPALAEFASQTNASLFLPAFYVNPHFLGPFCVCRTSGCDICSLINMTPHNPWKQLLLQHFPSPDCTLVDCASPPQNQKRMEHGENHRTASFWADLGWLCGLEEVT